MPGARVLDVGVEGALVPFRLDQQVAHRDPAAPLRPTAPGLGVEPLLVERADPVGARVGRQRHPEVLEHVRPAGAAHVARRGLAVLLFDRADELDVVAVCDLGVRLRLEQVLDVEVVERPDDRAAGDGRDHLHRAQQAELREPREDADVEERRAVAAPGEGKAELRMLPFLGHWRRAHDVTELGASQRESRLTQLGHDRPDAGMTSSIATLGRSRYAHTFPPALPPLGGRWDPRAGRASSQPAARGGAAGGDLLFPTPR